MPIIFFHLNRAAQKAAVTLMACPSPGQKPDVCRDDERASCFKLRHQHHKTIGTYLKCMSEQLFSPSFLVARIDEFSGRALSGGDGRFFI